MVSHVHFPIPPLDRYVESLFYYTGYEPAHSMDRLLPDGNVQLIFELTGSPNYIYDNQTLENIQTCRRVWFAGFRTAPITIPSGAKSEMIIVNFTKGGAFPFLKEPMHALTNEVVDAELVLRSDILRMWEKLISIHPAPRKLSWLARSLAPYAADTGQSLVSGVLNAIVKNPAEATMKDLVRQCGCSQRHVIKKFKEEVGVTPKEFMKISRFQHALARIESGHSTSWSELSLDCGYYDQSHLIAEFRAYSGFTPVQYLRHQGDLLNYIPVG